MLFQRVRFHGSEMVSLLRSGTGTAIIEITALSILAGLGIRSQNSPEAECPSKGRVFIISATEFPEVPSQESAIKAFVGGIIFWYRLS